MSYRYIFQKGWLLVLMLGVTLSLSAQQLVTGTVSDGAEPLPGVSILVRGTNQGTQTDANGAYSINVGPEAVLEFSLLGFRPREETVGDRKVIDVVLTQDASRLDEVVVTALGMEKDEKSLGYSVTEISGAELAVTNETNPVNALQGRVAGVQIDMGAGGLFGNSKILIRGNSTLGKNNQPIFVIDGVIMDNDIFEGNGRDFGNDLKNLNMNDFESVSVLKGSAAAALYGSRAINGVVLITTKKGKRNTGLGINLTQTFNSYQPYSGPDFQNVFGGGTAGPFFSDRRDPNYTADQAYITKVFPVDPATGKPYIDQGINRELENWGPRMEGQEVLNYDGTPTRFLPQPDNFLDAFQNGFGSNTNLSLDGGTEKSTFRLSYNRNESEGVVRNNELVKNAFGLRVTHELHSRINLDVSANYSSFRGLNPPRLGGLDAFASYNYGKLFTWMLPRNYDTEYWMQPEHYISALGGAPNPNSNEETNKAPESRFWFNLFENNYFQKEQMLRSRVAITAELTGWSNLILEGSLNNVYTETEDKELGQGEDFAGGLYRLGHRAKENYFLKAMVTAQRDITPDLDISGYIGGEIQRTTSSYNKGETSGGLSYPGNYFLANSVNEPVSEGGIDYRRAFNSLYASADLSFKDQLYLQATWRGDWSSALTYTNGTGNNFFHYPSVSLSWIFTETFDLPSWISYGKFRTNIAALGSDTDPFVINPGFAFEGFTNIGGQDLPISTFGDRRVRVSNLKPERKIAKEIGAEMRFFNGRLGFDLSLYQDNTRNQILDISTPVESGVDAILINAGNIQNKGIELAIDAIPVEMPSFSWSTALNYSRNRNLIVELYEGRSEFNLGANIAEISSWAVVGKSYGTLRSSIQAARFQATDDSGNPVDHPHNGKVQLAWRSDARAAFPARSNIIQDVGDINAKFRGGWDNTIRYKNFSLNVLVDAKIGGDFVLATYRYGTHTGVLPNTLFGRDEEYGGIPWTSEWDDIAYDDGIIPDGVFAEGQIITKHDGTQVDVGGMTYEEAYKQKIVEPTHAPHFYYRYGSSSTGVSDYWIFENSWVSLRQVALDYQFPQEFCRKLKLNTLSLGVVGRDLLYLYNSLPYNYNPASNNSNNTAFYGEEGFLPMIRSLAFTLRVGL
ncbi:iron complex outermembrane receptor protein [Anseongella ginsenosidimutans]|uniref:Iron complex outermembrane receptor protein n=1 Tax=Anseongella ginsenosidimutans TaxID=496056 RepID=A0A4R3KMR7_9SPHI|nr:SusC/RagA family TonB-linked outer membrane protein [Anseongella ginsenosidimutans]QEC52042.1 SusC/RagA family TonB-linked outer membrane protein [Anseongella ginsenosidimutans]TCS85650.1 iron complex outermembrane receptor protein [Anseongella ginsenosidimutans]